MEHLKRVLLGSPIYQQPNILKEFLTSILELEKNNYTLDCMFIDDNEEAQSSQLLNDFAQQYEGDIHTTIVKSDDESIYVRENNTHHWDEHLIWKVASFKDKIIEYAREHDYDYLFFVDSDLVLHPLTISHLISTNKDIISEIFWTAWKPDQPKLPQVWLEDFYTLYRKARNEDISEEEAQKRTLEFINMLKIPGVYEVGGLGACTLISKKALNQGVSFKEIPNISFWGEDRHFCIRAQAIGFQLFVDTHYPAYHIYRDADLAGVSRYKLEEVEKDGINFSLRNGLQNLGTFDFKRGYIHEWKSYFAEDTRASLESLLEQQTEENIKTKLTVQAEIINAWLVQLNDDFSHAIYAFTLKNTGTVNDAPFEEVYNGEAILIKEEEQWKISNFQIFE